MSPANIVRDMGVSYYFGATFGTQPFLANTTWRVKDSEECRPRMAYFFVLPDEASIFTSGLPFVMQLICTKNMSSYKVHLSYVESQTTRLPPPYDTKCFDYHQKLRLTTTGQKMNSSKTTEVLSSAHCYERCLTRHTAIWNLVPDTTAIERDKFINSSMDIGCIRVIEDDWYLKNRTRFSKRKELMSRYVNLAKKWPVFKKACRRECHRSDCYSSRIVPSLSYLESVEAKNNKDVSSIHILLKISDHSILQLDYLPKQDFLDLFVYLCGGASFWLGFCPINVAGWIEGASQRWKDRRKKISITVKHQVVSDRVSPPEMKLERLSPDARLNPISPINT
jgi:hypothetical protein